MKKILLHEFMPDDDCGHEWEHCVVIDDKQCYGVEEYSDWESGSGIDSFAFTVEDDLYSFAYGKVLEYLESHGSKWEKFANMGYCWDFIYFCYKIYDSDVDEEKIPGSEAKESAIFNAVSDFVECGEKRIDFETMEPKYFDLFVYISRVCEERFFSLCGEYFEDELEGLSLEDLKAKIIEEWKE